MDNDERRALLFWTMANGKLIHIAAMSDQHLRNAHKHVLKRAEAWDAESDAAMRYTPASSDSMASYYADRAADDASESAREFRLWADLFVDEMTKRGVQPLA